MSTVTNLLLYQIAWFCCVLGAAQGRPLLGPLVVAAVLVGHLAVLSRHPGRELSFIALTTAAGLAVDSLYQHYGLLRFSGTAADAVFAPPWIAALWASFATIINHSLAWLRERTALCALLGAVGGPLAYWAGARLGALEWQVPLALGLAVMALGWALVLPLLCAAARHLLGGAAKRAPAAGEVCS